MQASRRGKYPSYHYILAEVAKSFYYALCESCYLCIAFHEPFVKSNLYWPLDLNANVIV